MKCDELKAELLRRNNAELKEAQRWRKFSEEKHFVQVFWANIGLMPDELNKILAKRRRSDGERV